MRTGPPPTTTSRSAVTGAPPFSIDTDTRQLSQISPLFCGRTRLPWHDLQPLPDSPPGHCDSVLLTWPRSARLPPQAAANHVLRIPPEPWPAVGVVQPETGVDACPGAEGRLEPSRPFVLVTAPSLGTPVGRSVCVLDHL